MMASNVAIRLGVEGGAEIRRSLDEVGKAGQSAFQGLANAADGASAAADRTTERWKRMAQAAREAQAADRAQEGINRLLGVSAGLDQNASRERFRDLEAAFAPIPARADAVAVANDNVTKSIGLQRHEWQNLTRQIGDAGTMLAMGSSPLQVILSQGDQVRDILQNSQGGVKGALKDIGSTFLSALTPARLFFGGIVTGATAAGVAAYSYLSQQKEIEQRLSGIGRASGMTARDVNRITDSARRAPGQSVGDAREALTTFASTGRIGQEIGAGLIPMGDRLSRMLGVDLTEANDLLAKAFADPAKGAESLNEKLGNLNESTRRQIELQMAAGDRLGAQKTLLDSVAASTAGASKEVGLLADAWARAKGIMDTVGRAGASVIAPSIEQQLATARKQVDDLTRAEEGLTEAQRRRGARAWARESGQTLADARERVKQLEEDQIERDRASAFSSAAAAQAQRSADAGERIKPYLAERDSIEKLRAELKALDDLRKNPPADIPVERIEEAYRKANEQVESNLSSEAKRRQSDELAIRSINARTDAERAAIAAEQKRLELAGQRVDIDRKQAELDAQRVAMARSTPEAEDRLRASNDNLALAGLLPYQRSRAEIDQRFRRQNEENAGNPEALRRNAAARANELRALETEQLQGPLRQTTLSINEQIAALKVQRDGLFASDQAAAEMAARQELVNAAIRAGVPLTEAYGGQLETLAKKLGEVKVQQEEFNRARSNIVGGMDETRSGFTGALSGLFSDLRNRRDPTQGLLNSFDRMTGQFIERSVLKPLSDWALGKLSDAGGGAIGDIIAKSGVFGTLPQTITAPVVTIQAASVTVTSLGGALGANPLTGTPLAGAGSGLLGFGLGGAKEVGTASRVGSGLTQFGFGPLGSSALNLTDPRAASIAASAQRLGANPIDLATVISYETGGTFSPSIRGGAGNRHIGLIQFGSSEQQKYGAHQGQSFDEQMGAVERYLTDRGFKAGMGRLDLYSTINAGRPGLYGASDAANGGMPGTVADKVRDQMFNHERKARSLFGLDRGADLDASKALENSTQQATKSMVALGDAAQRLPDAVGSAETSLGSLASSLLNFKPGDGSGSGGGLLSSLTSWFGGGSSSTATVAAAADGGLLQGPGGPRSDNLLVRVSPGEFVVNAAATRRHYDVLSAINSGRFGGAFADGGLVDIPPLRDGRSVPVSLKDARPATTPPAANGNAGPTTINRTYNFPPMANGVTPQDIVKALEEYDSRLDEQLPARVARAGRRYG